MSTTVSLTKGQSVSLTKTDPSLNKLMAGLGWSPRKTAGEKFDLDASVFMLTESGKVKGAEGFIFYGKLESNCGSIIHKGDNRTGEGEGDDETILIDLSKIPADITKLVIVVSIDDAVARKQTFGQVDNSFIRLVNADTEKEVARFDLTEDSGTETALKFAEIYRHNGEWKFKAISQGYTSGLKGLVEEYGLSVSN